MIGNLRLRSTLIAIVSVGVGFGFNPGTSVGDYLEGRVGSSAERVSDGVEVGPGRPHDLGHHNTLGSVDDERSTIGHLGYVSERNELFALLSTGSP